MHDAHACLLNEMDNLPGCLRLRILSVCRRVKGQTRFRSINLLVLPNLKLCNAQVVAVVVRGALSQTGPAILDFIDLCVPPSIL